MRELDDFKDTWRDASNQIKKPQALNRDMTDIMSGRRYQSKLKKIIIPELLGSLVCLGSAVFIGFSFDEMDTAFLKGVGALSILLLLVIPAISLWSTWKLYRADNMNKSYAETLTAFAVQKRSFIKLQKLSVTLSYLLLVTIIILLAKIVGGKDISENKPFWIFSFSLGYIFLLFYSKWVMKHYRRVLLQSEELLHELKT